MKPSDDQNYVGNLAIVVMSCSGDRGISKGMMHAHGTEFC